MEPDVTFSSCAVGGIDAVDAPVTNLHEISLLPKVEKNMPRMLIYFIFSFN